MSSKIIVVGAGLVGCLLSVMLRRRGFQVQVLEKRPDIRRKSVDGDRSINLVITSKGIRALSELDLAKGVLSISSPVSGRMMHLLEGELTYQPYGIDPSEVNHAVSRSKLNQLLLETAEREGVEFFFESELGEIDSSRKSLDAGNATYEFDILFGADGAGSAVRKLMESMKESKTRSSMTPLGIHYKEMLMPASKTGDFPLRGDCLHIWPRGQHMLMSLPNIDRTLALILCMPPEDFQKLDSDKAIEDYFNENYPDSLEHMPDYVEDFHKHPTSMLGTLRCENWVYEDQICLIGDAAHAIVPFFGQGTNCGFDDVRCLKNLLSSGNNDWQEVFSEYYKIQKPSADAIADMSVENYNVMSSKVADPQFLLQKKVEKKLELEFPDRYCSRYRMVTYTLIPYDKAKKAGEIQKEILEELCAEIDREDQVDMKLAENLIEEKFIPFLRASELSMDSYKI